MPSEADVAADDAAYVRATLPHVALRPDDPSCAVLMAHGASTLAAASILVRDLPYGRNTDRASYASVLSERRGTCSTKHALLASVARASGVAVDLVVGIYFMTEANTPGVGSAMKAHGFDGIPEAHCYLRYAGRRLDLTHPGARGPMVLTVEEEHVIEPAGIGDEKARLHLAFLQRWAESRGVQLEDAWRAREASIAALSASTAALTLVLGHVTVGGV